VVENNDDLARASTEEMNRSKLGNEAYAKANPWEFADTPVIMDAQSLQPDSRIRKTREPLRPAGWDYQQYAAPTPTPTPKPTKKQRSAPATR
jgi:hypothetical protein